jgi:hypothetical protein
MPFPQIRHGIAVRLRAVSPCDTRAPLLDTGQKRLQRDALARCYHWKQRHQLPPRNLHQRQF